ncbi:MAG: membrane protein insertase YidC [Verrucomicrobia bacterium]|nr:membrane protein insertase YidC [Verrucomicrobiota bacterium]
MSCNLGWFLGLYLGFIAWIAKLMLTLMGAMHGFSGNWGVAIILTTLVIRLMLWPLTAKAAKASKRMQKLQKPIKELQEKYKDDPRKQQEAMLALWKKYKINPLNGCWPVLVQFPIFIAFFNLLRNSSDLRFADFLWINDLSMPDATISLGGNVLPLVGSSINVLPFLWLISMYYQMKLMPQPSIDNFQAKMIKWMPFIFFPFTYFFSSGLVLYWTTTNCFSIFQQYITNRRRDEDDARIEQELEERARKADAIAPTGPLIKKKKKKKKAQE